MEIYIDLSLLRRPLLLVIGWLLILPGCADPNRGIVSGSVTVDGQPAETGSIAFFPIDGESPTSGGTIKDGSYRVEATVGEARIEIRVPIAVGEKKLYDTPDSPLQTVYDESLPSKYNDESELIYEVPAGKSQKDFELTTE